MRIGIVADLHFRGSDREASRETLRRALSDMKSAGVERVLCAGDLFDSPRVLDRFAMPGTVLESFLEPVVDAGLPWTIIEGNHDQSGPRDSSALMMLDLGRPLFDVVTKHGAIDYGPLQVLCLPWSDRAVWRAKAASAGTTWTDAEAEAEAWDLSRLNTLNELQALRASHAGYSVLLGHCEVEGSLNAYRFVLPGSTWTFTNDELEGVGADLIALGHYHLRQGHYVGALRPLNFGETTHQNGWQLVDLKTGKTEFRTVQCPRFAVVDWKDWRPDGWLPWDHVRIEGVPALKIHEVDTQSCVAHVEIIPVPEVREELTRGDHEEVDPGAPLADLLRDWLAACGDPDNAADRTDSILTEIVEIEKMAHDSGDVVAMTSGSLDRIRSLRIAGVGPHVDTFWDTTQGKWLAVMGSNGVGKTYLLEALLAVYRGGFPSRGSVWDNLCPAGEGFIEVVFDSRGDTWRATRRWKKRGKTQSAEAFLTRIDCGVESPWAGPKINDFERAMEELLGPIEFLLGSAFLSQSAEGDLVEASEPSRMEFMRRFLCLDRFDLMSRLAKDKKSEYDGRLSVGDDNLKSLPLLREDCQRIELDLAAVSKEVIDLDAEIAAKTAEAEKKKAVVAGLKAIADRRDTLIEEERGIEFKIESLQRLVDQKNELLHDFEKRMSREEDLKIEVDSLPELRAALQSIAVAREARNSALKTRGAIEVQVNDLKLRRSVIEQRIESLRQRMKSKPDLELLAEQVSVLEKSLDELRTALANVERLSGEATDLNEDLNREEKRNDREKERRLTEIDRLRHELDRARHRSDSLKTVGCSENLLSCPLIDDSRKERDRIPLLEAEIEALQHNAIDEEAAHARIESEMKARLQEVLAAIAEAESVDHEDESALKGRLHDARSARETLAGLEHVEKSIDDAVADLEQTCRMLNGAENGLSSIVVPPEPSIDEEDALKASLASAEIARDLLAEIGEMARAYPREKIALDELVDRVASHMKDRSAIQKQITETEDVSLKIDDANARLADVREEEVALQIKSRRLLMNVGCLQSEIDSKNSRIAELEDLEVSLTEDRRKRDAYDLIRLGCGRDGIPQMLIARSMPAVEELVQEICAVDFDDRFGLRFDTQKTLKKGDTRETFRILFSKRFGPEYDVRGASGGERAACRGILRAALLMYQSQRSSGSIRTSFLDEPAAHQDAQNIDSTLRMIDRIGDRFEQVFLVSHDDSLLTGWVHRIELERRHDGTHVKEGAR